MPGAPAAEPFGLDEDPARGPAPDARGEGWRLLPPSREDWLTDDEWEQWAAARCAEEEEPPDSEEAVDPDDPSLPGRAVLPRRPNIVSAPFAIFHTL